MLQQWQIKGRPGNAGNGEQARENQNLRALIWQEPNHIANPKIRYAGWVATACLLLLTACGGGSGENAGPTVQTTAAALPAPANTPDSYNTATYDSIATKLAQASGQPVTVNANLFLGWTGAWDTVVMKRMNLLEKWLPKGSTVNWKRNLQGPPVITDLLADKQNVAYLGDNPTIVATTKRAVAPLNVVAFNMISPARMCGNLIVRSDAPAFNSSADVYKWLNGKTVAVPKGSCSDRTGQDMINKAGINVNWVYNQAEVIVTSLQAKKIDAAVVYEPNASKAVVLGYARYAASGGADNLLDANTIIMRKDFIDQNRAAAIAWLKADIQALYYMRDHPVETVNLIKEELPDFTKENLWEAFYGQLPASTGAKPVANEAVMTITPQAVYLADQVFDFLKKSNVVHGDKVPPDAIDPSLVNQAFKELGLDPKKALFEIKGGLPKDNPFTGDELKKPGSA